MVHFYYLAFIQVRIVDFRDRVVQFRVRSSRTHTNTRLTACLSVFFPATIVRTSACMSAS